MQKVNRLSVIIFLLLFAGKAEAQPFAPVKRDNPWKDDYRSVSRMTDYKKWGPYNVHDPSCKKLGDYYYMYSTDAIYGENKEEAKANGFSIGYIQIRRSKDLVNWEFLGWVFKEIPDEAVSWVRSKSGGHGASNVWAPYIVEHKGKYRLYYCVSAFGRNTSYIGMAESDNPAEGWINKGCVVKTDTGSPMNAIDPTVTDDVKTGEQWMTYGSYFGGLFSVKLNPESGFTAKAGDTGHLVARRANYKRDNLEAPEVFYNPVFKKYYLFVSYDPLFTTYNLRVGRSDSPAGPFTDFNGKDMKDTTNNLPLITAPYRFENHPGWNGVAHCSVFDDGKGSYYLAHQGRLAPDNQLMVLNIRQLLFTPDGWPVVSPERFAGDPPQAISSKQLAGQWEIIRLSEPSISRKLEAGQILPGDGVMREGEISRSVTYTFNTIGTLSSKGIKGKWYFYRKSGLLLLSINGESISGIRTFVGQDWENGRKTILFCGIDSRGFSIWGKKIK